MEIISLIWNELLLNPMQNGLVVIYAFLGRNFGLTIIVFTILVRLLTLPLTLRQIRSTRKMTDLQPKLQVIQKRYANDRARISQETMKLYKESGVNPIGCLGPLVIQMPIWIGLYWSIISLLPTSPERLADLSSHLYSWLPVAHQVVPLDSNFLWLDLAVADSTPIMPVLVGASMWVMQKISTPQIGDARQQSTNRMLLWMMPFMFGFLTLTLPSGLPLYWFVSNLIGVVIQYYVTGWGGLFPARARVVPTSTTADSTNQGENVSPDSEETTDGGKTGTATARNQRPERRRGNRSRTKGARRRTR